MKSSPRQIAEISFWLLLLLFCYFYFINAWVCDDAFITFRTIDNFTQGYGLRWNIHERVQVFTHPLWMFLLSFFYYFTSEIYYSTLSISFICCLSSIFIIYFTLRKDPQSPEKAPFFLLLLLSSKAFIDFTSSGLENPLSYLLATLFFTKFLFHSKAIKDFTEKETSYLFFIAALAFVNRQDTLLFYLPPLFCLCYSSIQKKRFQAITQIFTAILPATSWLLFATIYYGFPFPNTAYAKLINNGIPFIQKFYRGLAYIENSLLWDTLSWGVVFSTFLLVLRQKDLKVRITFLGVFLYLNYVLFHAASATHMSGRFFSVAFLISFLVFTQLIHSKKMISGIVTLSILFILLHPRSSLKIGTSWYKGSKEEQRNFMDMKWVSYRDSFHSLYKCYQTKTSPQQNKLLKIGQFVRKNPQKVILGGVFKSAAIGYYGYGAGPEKQIVDYFGLSDPLIARLPTCASFKPDSTTWISGHFCRVIPDGYLASIQKAQNQIKDPCLSAYYEKLENIATGPIFSVERFFNIFQINLGNYQYLIDLYALRHKKEILQHQEKEKIEATKKKIRCCRK